MCTIKGKFLLTPTISFEQELIDRKAELRMDFVALSQQISQPTDNTIKEKYITIHVPVAAIVSYEPSGTQVQFDEHPSGQKAEEYNVELQNTGCFLIDYSKKNDPQLQKFSITDLLDANGNIITQNPLFNISKGVSVYNTTSSIPPHVGNGGIQLP